MPAKSNPRNWNDVQTAIATTAIVTTLGLWNLFATPAKTGMAKSSEPVTLPPTEPPDVREVAPLLPTPLPQVKIMFTTQVAPQTTTLQQAQNNQQQQKKKKKNKDNNAGGGGGGGGTVSVTQTRTS